MHLWFATVLLLLKIMHIRKSDEQSRTHNKQRCLEWKLGWNEKKAFFQRFEVVDEPMLSIHKIDCTLKRVKLRWPQNPSRPGQLTSAIEFALSTIEAVEGRAPLARRDFANDTLDSDCSQEAKAMNFCEETNKRPSHLRCVNRFNNIQNVR